MFGCAPQDCLYCNSVLFDKVPELIGLLNAYDISPTQVIKSIRTHALAEHPENFALNAMDGFGTCVTKLQLHTAILIAAGVITCYRKK